MLFGYGRDRRKHIVHIEMKQWSNDTVTQIYDTGVFEVTALVGGSYRLLPHPSQQALHYQQNILNYVDVADTPESQLNGYAYCYNYKYTGKPNDLYAEQYKPVIERCPLNGGDQVVEFAKVLDQLLSGGKGKEVFREFTSCTVKFMIYYNTKPRDSSICKQTPSRSSAPDTMLDSTCRQAPGHTASTVVIVL